MSLSSDSGVGDHGVKGIVAFKSSTYAIECVVNSNLL